MSEEQSKDCYHSGFLVLPGFILSQLSFASHFLKRLRSTSRTMRPEPSRTDTEMAGTAELETGASWRRRSERFGDKTIFTLDLKGEEKQYDVLSDFEEFVFE